MSRVAVMRAVRRFCLECQGGSSRAVRCCEDEACALWAWRVPDEANRVTVEGTSADPSAGRRGAMACPALRAVRRHCLACAGGRGEVRACSAREGCALWSYRFGVTPDTYRTVRARIFGSRRLTLF